MNKLEVKHIRRRYGEKLANKDIDLVLENGIYGLLGPNGAGKSTFMRQITTLEKPDLGEIIYNGEDIFDMDDQYRDLLGYLPQEFGVYNNFSAQNFLLYMGALKGMKKKEAKIRVRELLELTGLYEVRHKAVGEFSGGMKRRVGIAQALLNDPKVLILDEPTAGLDPQERARFRNILSDISKDKIILISTHIISDIESVAKETIMMDKGEIIMKGSYTEIIGHMTGKVFTIRAENESELDEIRKKYKIINLQRNASYSEARVVSNLPLSGHNISAAAHRFEDVYMFYYDLENEHEVLK